uniref:[histone H3]-lysine(4) N-trimethyltransferase n=1 Tax=Mola mola TaxID=94237 RepID=A0A3Q3VLM1_MOLML
MAPKIERFVSPGKGNGLRATANIQRGELVYSAEPLASCVSNKLARDVLTLVFLFRCETLLRCSQCKMARYCGTTCQKQAWSGHKRECKCLQSLLPRYPTDSVRLAARLIFTVSEAHYLSSASEQKKQGLSQLASMLELYLQQELLQESKSALPPSCREPLSLMAKVTCNCFTISDGELQEIGVGLYPSLSLLNHDCRPNCVMVFEGTKLRLRAVRDISPDEELTISYIETLSLTEYRQRQLQDHCSHLLSTVGDEVPEENLYKLRMTDMALDASIHLGHWKEAVGYGQKTLPVYRMYYPDPHPVHGVQLMRVGKLQHYLAHIDEALDSFKQAYQIIKLTHGDQHPITTDLLMKMEECRTEMNQLSSS